MRNSSEFMKDSLKNIAEKLREKRDLVSDRINNFGCKKENNKIIIKNNENNHKYVVDNILYKEVLISSAGILFKKEKLD